MTGFVRLVADGADFEHVDRVMESWGWPMGPAYLEDVVGMDTGAHVSDVIGAGFPQRMAPIERDALRLMVSQGRFGQKNGKGFYRYERDPAGKPRRSSDPEAHALVASLQPHGRVEFEEAEIVDRLMLPMLLEAVHALADGAVGSPAELDTAMLLGVGYPAYGGGPLKTIDWLGAATVVARCERLAALGPAYVPPPMLRQMAAEVRRFYPT
jgi:3-hydroxyacyl-CoA dehydrogenase/enoyl-CoA hydratase/3-hydroxybutyryl-CoA epimerase/enoyl-CoA isomerase